MKLAIGLPWYAGPDDNTAPFYMDLMMYFGALRERSLWHPEAPSAKAEGLTWLPPVDETFKGSAQEEFTEEEWKNLGRIEIMLINRSRLSMVGKAREMIVEDAQEWGADWLLWWDADMLFEVGAFLALWRNQKPICGALAFTARHPIHPVIYRMRTHEDPQTKIEIIDGSDVVFDYPRDKLISNEDIGGELAFGAGVVLYDMKVFRELPQPWFNSTGCGEDWFFCHRCAKYNIPRFVDTRVKTSHKEHQPRWANEQSYWLEREAAPESYKDVFGPGLARVQKGQVLA